MKKADLQRAMDDGTAVAVAQYGHRKGRELPPAQKAFVVRLNAKRKAVSPGGWGNVVRDDGVRVRPPSNGERIRGGSPPATSWDWRGVPENQEKTTHVIVGPHQVIATWDEYQEMKAAEDAAKRVKDQARRNAEAEVIKVNDYFGKPVANAHYQVGIRSAGRYTGNVIIPWEELRRLRKRAEG